MPLMNKSQGKSLGGNERAMVAVDFGTTFTSVAYANTKSPGRHMLLRKWGDGGHQSKDSVPSVLRYDNDGTTGAYVWGFRAQRLVYGGKKIHEWFKLGLCKDFERRRAQESELLRKYKSSTAMRPVRDEECENLVINFLSSVRGAVDKFIGEHHQGIDQPPISYIITVPALWSHAEQEKTRECAERAGMGKGNQLQIISEPEAACMYAIQTMYSMKVDDTFVICDAGGGTVDLSSYTIESSSMNPFYCKLSQAAAGSGALCCSSFLDRICEDYLRERFKDYPYWEPSFTIDAVKIFEEETKRDFTGESNEKYEIKIQGLVLSAPHGIYKRDHLTLTTKELRDIFDKVISKVQGLVRDQIANTERPVKAVLLAGGFGQNRYLQKKLRQIDAVVKRGIKVELIDNSDTAIARGALIAGLAGLGRTHSYTDDGFNACPNGPQVISRIAGMHYGTVAYYDFVEGTDPEERKVERDDGLKIEKMHWFANTGDRILEDQPMTFNFSKVAMEKPGVEDIHIYTSEERIPPDYLDENRVKELVKFQLDLRGLAIPREWINGTELYEAKFVIEMTLHAASLSFCAVYRKGTPDAWIQ